MKMQLWHFGFNVKKPVIILAVFTILSFLWIIYPGTASAANVSLSLSSSSALPGQSVVASGMADASTWVTLKVLDSNQSILVFDSVKSGADGAYSCTFILPDVNDTLTVVAGYGTNVASASLGVFKTTAANSTYVVNFAGLTGATAAADKTRAAAGELVTVSISNIAAGKHFNSISITAADNSAVATTALTTGGVYTFKMPAQAVTITVALETITSASNGSASNGSASSSTQTGTSLSTSGGKVSTSENATTVPAITTEKARVDAPAAIFKDISTNWAKDYISTLVQSGAISGYPDATFKPDNIITRAEFTTVLVKAFRLPIAVGRNFNDTASHWAEKNIATAYAAGIINGYSDSSFGPDDPISREQLAVMIVKAAKINKASTENTFTDGGNVSAWAKDALNAVNQAGIMKGYPNGTFNPQGKVTRAETAAVIVNALK